MQIELTGAQLEEILFCLTDRRQELKQKFQASAEEELSISINRRIEDNGILFRHLLHYLPAWYTKHHVERFEKT